MYRRSPPPPNQGEYVLDDLNEFDMRDSSRGSDHRGGHQSPQHNIEGSPLLQSQSSFGMDSKQNDVLNHSPLGTHPISMRLRSPLSRPRVPMDNSPYVPQRLQEQSLDPSSHPTNQQYHPHQHPHQHPHPHPHQPAPMRPFHRLPLSMFLSSLPFPRVSPPLAS